MPVICLFRRSDYLVRAWHLRTVEGHCGDHQGRPLRPWRLPRRMSGTRDPRQRMRSSTTSETVPDSGSAILRR